MPRGLRVLVRRLQGQDLPQPIAAVVQHDHRMRHINGRHRQPVHQVTIEFVDLSQASDFFQRGKYVADISELDDGPDVAPHHIALRMQGLLRSLHAR